MRKSKGKGDRVAEAIDRGWDMGSRTIYLHGEINEEAARKFMVALSALDEVGGPIKVSLSSCGGEMDAGLAIYDAVRATENPVVIIGTGRVRSMASIVLQAGDERLLTPTAFMMLHDGHIVIAEAGALQYRDARRIGSEIRTMDKLCDTLVRQRSGLSSATLRRLNRTEKELSSAEAVSLGLADAVAEARPFQKSNGKTSH